MQLTLSPSQVSVFRDECQRKWGFRSIAKIDAPQHASAALGSEVDEQQLQPYLRDGRPFELGRPSRSGEIAASALPFLPEPKSFGMELQKHFVFPSHTEKGLFYQGYKDLWLAKGGMPEIAYGNPTVTDFKTTSDLKWQKSAEVLKTDVQAMVYATNAMFVTGERVVDLVWIYMRTKGAPKAKRTHLQVTASHVVDQYGRINELGMEMAKTRAQVEALGKPLIEAVLELPPNPKACDGYGGCPYKHICNLSPAVFESSEMEVIDMSNTMELLAKMRAKKAGGAPASPVVEALGINPPESLLPPAPAVGAVSITPAAALVEAIATGNVVTGPVPVEEPSKVKRGRPAGKQAVSLVEQTDEAQRHQRIGALVVELLSLVTS